MNDDKPESIWKKSWAGWNWLRAWLIVMAATFLTILLLSFLIPGRPRSWLLALSFLLAASTVIATFVVFLWFFIRWLCYWRNFRRFLFAFTCLVTLIAFFYAEEDWRGKHDWEKFKRQWEAKGEHFSYASIIPPPVPDDQNFAMAPIWISLIDEVNTNATLQWYGKDLTDAERARLADSLSLNIYADGHSDSWPTNGNWLKAAVTDLTPWQEYYRKLAATTNLFPASLQPQSPAQDVLLALSRYDVTIEELRKAGQRPHSRFPIEYDKENPAMILLPHLAVLKRSAQVLELRAIAELQNGESEEAFEDVKLSLRLIDSVQSEPFIISHLVRFAMLHITMQPIYEGLALHQWSDAQLTDLDAELAKLDFLADYEFCIHAEPAVHIKLIDYLEQKRSRWSELAVIIDFNDEQKTMNNLWTMLAFYLAPKGWFYQNELVLVQTHQKWYEPMVNDAGHIVEPKIVEQGGSAELNLRPTLFNFFARLEGSPLGAFAQKSAYAQSAADLSRLAIAVERYRLAHGKFPDSLDALAPQFMAIIPHDIINGEPLHYRRTADSQFVLYSVGWNETDDGGVVGLTSNGENVNNREGDWVWRYPAR